MCICFSSQKHRTTFTNRLTHFPQFSCTIIVCPFVTYQDMYLPNICTLFCPVPANAISISTFLCVWSKRGKQFTSKGESMRNWRKESLPHSCASSMWMFIWYFLNSWCDWLNDKRDSVEGGLVLTSLTYKTQERRRKRERWKASLPGEVTRRGSECTAWGSVFPGGLCGWWSGICDTLGGTQCTSSETPRFWGLTALVLTEMPTLNESPPWYPLASIAGSHSSLPTINYPSTTTSLPIQIASLPLLLSGPCPMELSLY